MLYTVNVALLFKLDQNNEYIVSTVGTDALVL